MAIDIRAQREAVFVLMHKDVAVLEYNMSGKRVTVLNTDMVPWGFNYLGFEEWCAGRVLSMSRKNAKYIMNALMVSQDNSVRTKMQLALAYLSDGTLWEVQTALFFRWTCLPDCAVPELDADYRRNNRRLS